MLRLSILTGFAIAAFAASTPTVVAQTKPMHSGHMSHGAPQMRVHGSGLHRPNRPHFHHHEGYAGYRPVHRPYAPETMQANEGGLIF